METILLKEADIQAVAARAAEVLRAGGVILYPTDTLYGLGADAFSDEAVAKIYAIKGRDEGKPMHAVFAELSMAEKYGAVNGIAKKLAGKFLPGALTLILKKKSEIDTGIAKGISTVGVRIPDNEFCLEVARRFRPFTATSANKSGMMPQRSVAAIIEQLGDAADMIDLIIDVGELPERQPTTVVDVSSGALRILREGAIPSVEILAV